MGFKRHRESDDRIRSAIAAIKGILPLPLTKPHRRRFLSLALWKLTEADGKYKTRFQSKCSIGLPRSDLRHEHVYRREKMISDLIANPEQVDRIAARAVACVVTKEEHERLHKIERELDGWERYKRAGIVVIDTQTGSEADLNAVSSSLEDDHEPTQ